MQSRKSSSLYRNNSLLLCLVMLVCLVAAPSVNSRTDRYTSGLGSPVTGMLPLSITQEGIAYLTTEATVNEIMNHIDIYYLTSRDVQNFQRILLRIFNNMLPISCFSVLIYCFGYLKRKRTKHKSVMAFSIGGHAPPSGFFLNNTV